MKIANRDMMLVGIKLIGLWVLFHAVINLAQSAITGTTMHRAHNLAEARAPWQAPEGISEELAAEMTEKWKMDDSMNKFTYQIQAMRAWANIPWQLIMALIGLYMCRFGALVLQFLGAENEENPNQGIHGIQ